VAPAWHLGVRDARGALLFLSAPIRSSVRKTSGLAISVNDSLAGVDWSRAKRDLAADDFDNGRTSGALRESFERSQHVVIARDGAIVVGMARLLSDGVCNAYLLDV
jgi:hypothetical protein